MGEVVELGKDFASVWALKSQRGLDRIALRRQVIHLSDSFSGVALEKKQNQIRKYLNRWEAALERGCGLFSGRDLQDMYNALGDPELSWLENYHYGDNIGFFETRLHDMVQVLRSKLEVA